MKTAIVTLYGDRNIGNKLQNLAVQKLLEDKGMEVCTLRYIETPYYESSLRKLMDKLCMTINYPKETAKELRLIRKREQKFRAFSNRYISKGQLFSLKKIPEGLSDKFDFFISGSDQVWKNWSDTKEELNYFLLSFADREKRIALSPSFGKNTVEDRFKENYVYGLNGFRKLSCREKQGAELIYELTGKEVPVLVDPTMCITKEEWTTVSKRPDYLRSESEKFILLYSLGKRSEIINEFISNTAKENGLKVIDILNKNNEDHYCTSPDEFLYLCAHAKLIVTDSFHACVFSILFGSNFVVFDRDSAVHGDMSSRLNTLLSSFGLEDRQFNKLDKDRLFSTDFVNAENVLKKERDKMNSYLDECFAKNQ